MQIKQANFYAGSDFTNIPDGVNVASQAIPLRIKCALQYPLLLSFHCLTGTDPNIDLNEANTMGGGAASTEAQFLTE